MAGTVVIIVILVLAPIPIAMGTSMVAAILGWAMNEEADTKHEDSELLTIAYRDHN